MCGRARPPVDQAGSVGITRSQAPFVVVRQKLGLICGHIDLHGAIMLAPLAREAEVESLTNGLTPPAVFDNITANHFIQQASAAASRMFLFMRDHVAGAHGFIAALMAAAHPGTDATIACITEAVMIV